MRFSTVLASFTVLTTASARSIPDYIGFQGLPQIATNVSTIMSDLNNLDNCLANLTTVMQTSGSSGVVQTVLDIGTIIRNTIGVQMANHQAKLDAQELDQVFTPENSSAIVSILKDRIFPHAQAALDALKSLKAQNFIGKVTTDSAILVYLQNIQLEFAEFSRFLLKWIDTASKEPAQGTLGDIGQAVNATAAAYTN